MRKFISCLTLLIVFAGAVNANPVGVSTAKTVANNFFTINTGHTVNSVTLAYTGSDNTGNAVYYVFNINAGQASEKGFVIVSADDATHPILGYGNENRTYTVPASRGSGGNVSFWMGKKKSEISKARQQNLTATPAIANEWKRYMQAAPTTKKNSERVKGGAGNFPSSSYYLVQSLWDQSTFGAEYPDPYNYFCPGGSVTGCVATAMTQIMRYWSWPPSGVGASCDSISNYANQVICDGYTHNYDWNDMELIYPSGGDTNIARIMYDAGISVDMEYSQPGSDAMVTDTDAIDSVRWRLLDTACAQHSLVKYFRYDASHIRTVMARDYSTSGWISLLEAELDTNRPINYAGYLTDSSEGHSWVCDGYDAFDNFHMNWGWGGYDNGWYALDALDPYDPSETLDFSSIIEAIIGIQPDTVGSGTNSNPNGIPNISTSNSINVYPNPSSGVFTFQIRNLQSGIGNQVEVYNMLGEKVYSKEFSTLNSPFSIDLSNNAKGVYLYRVIDSDGSLLKQDKLVIE